MRRRSDESYERAVAGLMIFIGIVFIGIIGLDLAMMLSSSGFRWNAGTIFVFSCAALALGGAFLHWFKAGRHIVQKKNISSNHSSSDSPRRMDTSGELASAFKRAWKETKADSVWLLGAFSLWQ